VDFLRGRDWGWVPQAAVLVAAGLFAFFGFGAPLIEAMEIDPGWLTGAGVALVLAICLGRLAVDDASAFVSIAVPSFMLAVASMFVSWPVDLALGLLAIALPASFSLAGDWVWPPWWRLVLRRPALPRWWIVERHIGAHGAALEKLMASEVAAPAGRDQFVRAATREVARLRRIRAPDAAWASLRDDIAAFEEAWIASLRGTPGVEDPEARSSELRSRLEALVAQSTDSPA
jgi:hypothetical protein